MQIEVSEQTRNELQRRAQAVGLGVAEYLESVVLAKAGRATSEPPTVDELRSLIRQSSANLERNGRPWRELTHEGHKY